MTEKKYSVSYTNGASGYGWNKEYDRLNEFEDFITTVSRTSYVCVYDNEIDEIIYEKDVLDDKPSIDFLHAPLRDFRFKSRTYRNCG
jgi:hypothetical protein